VSGETYEKLLMEIASREGLEVFYNKVKRKRDINTWFPESRHFLN